MSGAATSGTLSSSVTVSSSSKTSLSSSGSSSSKVIFVVDNPILSVNLKCLPDFFVSESLLAPYLGLCAYAYCSSYDIADRNCVKDNSGIKQGGD